MLIKKIIFVICFFMSFVAFAQDWTPPADSPGFGDSNNDAATNAPSVPIDGIEIPLLVTGIVIAVVVIRRMQKSILSTVH